ncbi:YktB family protein [Fictibacillus sp. Mic-4]|uniref:YktB family protein n=1 Tax=Fictibacillus sp. Mic-4 TaxID=3132826 RepID=UPI003CF97FE0
MMSIHAAFSKEDFDVFKVDGLEARMEKIKSNIWPKLEELGNYFAPILSARTGEEMFFHVAKHARRKVNPPNDTWVAFSSNSRGYKMLPHFQIGLFETHMFVWFAIIYECPIKEQFGALMEKRIEEIVRTIPDEFVWSGDHTKPIAYPHQEIKTSKLEEMIDRLKTVKKAELLCGIHLSREDVIHMSAEELAAKIDSTFETLLPLYLLKKQAYVAN